MSKELVQAIEAVSSRSSDSVVSKQISDQPRGDNLFMGIGLLSQGGLSEGLGMSSLLMLCAAACISRVHRKAEINILVADLHARENCSNFSDAELSDRADSTTLLLATIMHNLGCSANVFKASENSNFNPNSNSASYLDRQTLDVLTAHTVLNAGIKIGWATTRNAQNGVRIQDEGYFDNEAVRKHPEELRGLSFLRTKEGLSAQQRNGEHLFTPPYIGKSGTILGEVIVIRNLAGLSKQMKNHLSGIGRILSTTLQTQMPSLDLLQEFVDGLR